MYRPNELAELQLKHDTLEQKNEEDYHKKEALQSAIYAKSSLHPHTDK
jgi:hypothetical protein